MPAGIMVTAKSESIRQGRDNLMATKKEIKYKLTKDKFPRIACVQHNGEHPFSFKESVNGMVTCCHEVLTVREYEKIELKEGLK